MEERFKKLFETEEDLYTDGSPIILEKGVLLLDTKSNKLVIQMKFCNISEKPFKALYISSIHTINQMFRCHQLNISTWI